MIENRFKSVYKGLLYFSLLVSGVQVWAQQTPVFSEYNYNPFIINSAYAGLSNTAEITLATNGLLNSLEGSPENLNLSFHTPIGSNQTGVGAGLIRDKIGVTTSTSAFAAYSYKIFFDFKENRPYWQVYQEPSLSFGITAGVQKYENNLLELGITNDPTFMRNINTTIPTVGIGVLFNKSNFYAGLSTPNVLGTRFATDDTVELQSPFYGFFGYRFFSSRYENFMLKPSILTRYEKGAPLQADLNMSLSYRNQFEIGIGYRTNASVNLLAGVYLFESLRLIYHYNVAPERLAFGNTHGLILSFRFNRGFAID